MRYISAFLKTVCRRLHEWERGGWALGEALIRTEMCISLVARGAVAGQAYRLLVDELLGYRAEHVCTCKQGVWMWYFWRLRFYRSISVGIFTH